MKIQYFVQSKLIMLLIVILMASEVHAQTRTHRKPSGFFVFDNTEILYAVANDVSKFEVLDSSQFVVTYDFSEIRDPETRKSLSNVMKLQVGKRYTKFYSEKARVDDSIYTHKLQSGVLAIAAMLKIGSEIFVDRATSSLRENQRMPFDKHNHLVLFYQEPKPQFEWNVTDQTDTIMGYNCIKATTTYGGRDWEVWFTLDIPVSAGPWKLSGLPGLILRAEDSEQHFIYSCVGIQNQVKPIELYSWKYKEMTKIEFLDLYRKIHKTPMPYVNPDGSLDFIVMDVKGRFLDNSWSSPYNPMER